MAHNPQCQECGALYTRKRAGMRFCSATCRGDHNNRRAARGAILYDLFMLMRFERADAKGLWSIICRMASHWRIEDERQRNGRKSWSTSKEVRERNAALIGKLVG